MFAIHDWALWISPVTSYSGVKGVAQVSVHSSQSSDVSCRSRTCRELRRIVDWFVVPCECLGMLCFFALVALCYLSDCKAPPRMVGVLLIRYGSRWCPNSFHPNIIK